MMDSSGIRISEIEDYAKEKLVELHKTMLAKGVPADIVSNTGSLSLAIADFFLSSLKLDKLAELNDIEFEIVKREISIKVARVVIFACDKSANQ